MQRRIELYAQITKTNLKTWILLDFIARWRSGATGGGVERRAGRKNPEPTNKNFAAAAGPGTKPQCILVDQINKTHQIDSNQH